MINKIKVFLYYNMKDIYLYSDPSIVYEKAKTLYGNDVIIGLSSHKNKKYMIYNPIMNKFIHFGHYGMQDYTFHKDEQRRINFLRRNHKWRNLDIYSPGYLSYHLLW